MLLCLEYEGEGEKRRMNEDVDVRCKMRLWTLHRECYRDGKR